MSNLTNTYTEVINGIPIAGTALSDVTTATIISTAGQAGILPIGFFNYQCINKMIQCNGWGVVSTASSSPGTLTFTTSADPTVGSITGALALAPSGSITPATSLSNANWVFNTWSTVQSLSGGSAQIVSWGELTIGATSTTAAVAYTFGSSTAVSLTSALSTEYAIELKAAWGTASTSNSITCEQWIVQGMN